MIALLQTSQKVFLESAGQAVGTESTLSSESCNHIYIYHIYRHFWQLWFTRKFFTVHYLLA